MKEKTYTALDVLEELIEENIHTSITGENDILNYITKLMRGNKIELDKEIFFNILKNIYVDGNVISTIGFGGNRFKMFSYIDKIPYKDMGLDRNMVLNLFESTQDIKFIGNNFTVYFGYLDYNDILSISLVFVHNNKNIEYRLN